MFPVSMLGNCHMILLSLYVNTLPLTERDNVHGVFVLDTKYTDLVKQVLEYFSFGIWL